MPTDTKLRSPKTRAALYLIADSNGLCIEVSPAGSRLWRYRFRFNGKASMPALGEYPTGSLVNARRLHGEALVTPAAGIFP